MCTTNVSPTPDTGLLLDPINDPELSKVTWLLGSHTSAKIALAGA
jgi:hypothetical protein